MGDRQGLQWRPAGGDGGAYGRRRERLCKAGTRCKDGKDLSVHGKDPSKCIWYGLWYGLVYAYGMICVNGKDLSVKMVRNHSGTFLLALMIGWVVSLNRNYVIKTKSKISVFFQNT